MTPGAATDPAAAPAQRPGSAPRRPAPAAETGSSDLRAPLYVAWQITNECNLACLHCIEESGPGKAFRDELSEREAFAVLEQLMDSEVPYLSFSGGEPMVHPDSSRWRSTCASAMASSRSKPMDII